MLPGLINFQKHLTSNTMSYGAVTLTGKPRALGAFDTTWCHYDSRN